MTNDDSTVSSGHQSDRVYIFDTTRRDGEQSPGASMTLQEKVRLARQLVLLRAIGFTLTQLVLRYRGVFRLGIWGARVCIRGE